MPQVSAGSAKIATLNSNLASHFAAFVQRKLLDWQVTSAGLPQIGVLRPLFENAMYGFSPEELAASEGLDLEFTRVQMRNMRPLLDKCRQELSQELFGLLRGSSRCLCSDELQTFYQRCVLWKTISGMADGLTPQGVDLRLKALAEKLPALRPLLCLKRDEHITASTAPLMRLPGRRRPVNAVIDLIREGLSGKGISKRMGGQPVVLSRDFESVGLPLPELRRRIITRDQTRLNQQIGRCIMAGVESAVNDWPSWSRSKKLPVRFRSSLGAELFVHRMLLRPLKDFGLDRAVTPRQTEKLSLGLAPLITRQRRALARDVYPLLKAAPHLVRPRELAVFKELCISCETEMMIMERHQISEQMVHKILYDLSIRLPALRPVVFEKAKYEMRPGAAL